MNNESTDQTIQRELGIGPERADMSDELRERLCSAMTRNSQSLEDMLELGVVGQAGKGMTVPLRDACVAGVVSAKLEGCSLEVDGVN